MLQKNKFCVIELEMFKVRNQAIVKELAFCNRYMLSGFSFNTPVEHRHNNRLTISGSAAIVAKTEQIPEDCFSKEFEIIPLSDYDRKCNAWVTDNLHKIDWNANGKFDLREISDICSHMKFPSMVYFTKGNDKSNLLTTYFGQTVHNLEHEGCPRFKHLQKFITRDVLDAKLFDCTAFPLEHSKQPIIFDHCAQRKALLYYKWLAYDSRFASNEK